MQLEDMKKQAHIPFQFSKECKIRFPTQHRIVYSPCNSIAVVSAVDFAAAAAAADVVVAADVRLERVRNLDPQASDGVSDGPQAHLYHRADT
jgi:hypothetical protein